MELKANSSNNTIFADADGDIAYFHGNFSNSSRPKKLLTNKYRRMLGLDLALW
jgi:hypothetical protein